MIHRMDASAGTLTRHEEVDVEPADGVTADSAPGGMVWIPGGEFTMGSDWGYPEEGPTHQVSLDGYWIDRYPVTNELFERFVETTNYVTVAERTPRPTDYPGVPPEKLVAGSAVFHQPPGKVDLADPANWWRYTPGANWPRPAGPAGDSIEQRGDNPVVQVAFDDALAFADWADKELPTEPQWEYAARGGLEGQAYAWGDDDLNVAPHELANVWHGEFPWDNRKRCSPGVEPTGRYPANGFGLFDMIGNVWEWTLDYWSPGHGQMVADEESGFCCSPASPRAEVAFAEVAAPTFALRVLKGGSFLCAPNYCARFRPAARIPQASDSSSNHMGFRCVLPGSGGTS